MPLNAGNAEQRRRQRKNAKSRPHRPSGGPHRPRPQAASGATAATSTARPVAKPAAPARPAKAAPTAARAGDIDARLQALDATARAQQRPWHREAALLVLAALGCWLIPADAGRLGLTLQDWAFLAVPVLLAGWLRVGLRRRRAALVPHFDAALSHINRAVADPAERLVCRSRLARLRAEALAPRRLLGPAPSLLAAGALYVAALLAAHLGA